MNLFFFKIKIKVKWTGPPKKTTMPSACYRILHPKIQCPTFYLVLQVTVWTVKSYSPHKDPGDERTYMSTAVADVCVQMKADMHVTRWAVCYQHALLHKSQTQGTNSTSRDHENFESHKWANQSCISLAELQLEENGKLECQSMAGLEGQAKGCSPLNTEGEMGMGTKKKKIIQLTFSKQVLF